uniref:Uncharacterized protein n=1 Tax=Romanomermis culicivorax TaxID=13658 RepID=A0A915K9L6_ROMCU
MEDVSLQDKLQPIQSKRRGECQKRGVANCTFFICAFANCADLIAPRFILAIHYQMRVVHSCHEEEKEEEKIYFSNEKKKNKNT